MELRQLKYFVMSAEYLNFSEAAKHLFITQSTLSQQIKQLEFELGFPLFTRSSRRMVLTEAGEEFLPFAQKTIRDAEDGVQRLHDLQHVKAGTLRVGVTYSLSSMLTEGLMRFMKHYPDVKLNICYETVNRLLELLKERKLDFVLSYKPVNDMPEIDSISLFENPLSAVVAVTHPLAERGRISLAEMQNYPLVLPSKDLQARMMLERLMQGKDFSLTSQVELNETNILLQLVSTGNYVTVLSASVVFDNKRFKAVPLDEPDNTMTASMLTLKGAYQKASAAAFINILLDTDAVKRRAIIGCD
ncbi:MAG: LysR family transcriptional regulator [Bacteroidaceae bacterium]|nr:LysR family transcriptional regulator [Bacteroidaceae bacterium]